MKRKIHILASAVIALFCFCLIGCSAKPSESGGKLCIVTTNFPLYDFARAAAGEKADITLLLPVGTESHSYEPTPKDIIKIKECDLFLCIGGTDEYWAEKVLDSFDSPKKSVLKLIEKVDTLYEEDDENETDGHIWTSTDNAAKMVSEISSALALIDPANEEYYLQNAEGYISQINEIGSEISDISKKAESKVMIFGSRFPFRYFAEQFDFECYAAFPACGEESEPSAATVTMLIEKIKENNISAVYYPELSSTKVAQTLCSETGAEMLLLHSCHNVTAEEFENGETYISLMKKNIVNLKKGLKTN